MERSGGILTILAILLAVPLVAYCASAGIQWKFNSTLQQKLLKLYPDKAHAISAMSVTSFCQISDLRSDQSLGSTCEQNDNVELMMTMKLLT